MHACAETFSRASPVQVFTGLCRITNNFGETSAMAAFPKLLLGLACVLALAATRASAQAARADEEDSREPDDGFIPARTVDQGSEGSSGAGSGAASRDLAKNHQLMQMLLRASSSLLPLLEAENAARQAATTAPPTTATPMPSSTTPPTRAAVDAKGMPTVRRLLWVCAVRTLTLPSSCARPAANPTHTHKPPTPMRMAATRTDGIDTRPVRARRSNECA